MDTPKLELDITILQRGFEDLMNDIEQIREKMSNLKKGTQEYAEESQRLKAKEEELIGVIDRLGQSIDYSNVSYKNLSKTMAEVNNIAKSTTLEDRTNRYANSLLSMNNALKQADREIGNFSRSVGSYGKIMDDGLTKATANVGRNITQVVRELPSLANSPEQFLMAISNNLPYLVEAIAQFSELKRAQQAATAATEALTLANSANNASNITNSATTEGRTVTIASNAVQTANAAAATSRYTMELNELISTERLLTDELTNIISVESIYNQSLVDGTRFLTLTTEQLNALAGALETTTSELLEDAIAVEKSAGLYTIEAASIGEATEQLERRKNVLNNSIEDKKKEIETLKDSKKALDENTKSTLNAANANKTLGMSTAALLGNIATIGLTIGILALPYIKKLINSMRELEYSFAAGSRSLKAWFEALRGANENAAKAATELIVYSKWAKDTTKTDEERSNAAKKVVNIMKEHNQVVDEAAITEGKFGDKIDEVTAKLIKQAQAQAMMTEVTKKYKEVLDAQSKLAEREANGPNFSDIWYADFTNQNSYGSINLTPQDVFNARIEEQKKQVNKTKEQYEAWLEKFLKDFDPSDLITNNKSSGYGSADRWKSYWEQAIKAREEALQQSVINIEGIETDFLQWSDKEWWKYTEQGNEYFNNMIDEYAKHYKDMLDKGKIDNDTYLAYMESLEAKTNQYRKNAALYFDKLQKQYVHPNYNRELQALEEWYILEKQKYKDLSMDAAELAKVDKEYYYQKYELAKKYRDEFQFDVIYGDNTLDINQQNREIELKQLDQWFEDEKVAYEQAGKSIEALTIEYERRKAAIKDNYRQIELDKYKTYLSQLETYAQIEVDKRLSKSTNYLANDTTNGYQNVDSLGSAINFGHNGGNFFDNLDYNQRMAEMQAMIDTYTNQMNTLRQTEIEINLALQNDEFSSAEERMAKEEELADIKMQQAKMTADYQMNMDKAVHQNAEKLMNERMQAVSATFNTMGDLFTNISTLCEEGSEEAKGFAIAGATMSTIASAVEAYKSVVGIPYVGPFLAPIAAASAIAAGIAQIKQIASTDPTGKSGTSIQNAYVGAMPSELQSSLTATPITTGATEQVNVNTGNQRVFILDKDISDSMNSYRARTSETTF